MATPRSNLYNTVFYIFFLIFVNICDRIYLYLCNLLICAITFLKIRQIMHLHVWYPQNACSRRCCFVCHSCSWKPLKSIMTSKNVVACQILGTIRKSPNHQKSWNSWSCPDPRSRFRIPNREIAKSRNRENAKSHMSWPGSGLPDQGSGSRIAKSRNPVHLF